MKLYNDIKKTYENTENGPVMRITTCVVFEFLEWRLEFLKSNRDFNKKNINGIYNHLDDMEMNLIQPIERWRTVK